MTITTYDGLKASIASYLMRDDLTDVIPDFITLAESRIARTLRVSDMEITATANMVDGYVELPTDFIEIRRLIGGGAYNQPLALTTPVQAAQDYVSSAAGVPASYTIVGNLITTYPSGGTGSLVMTYYAKPTPLSVGVQSNWLLTKAPEIYLYGALVESAPFQMDDARLETWGKMFKTACDNLQAADDRARYTTSVARVRGYTP